MKKCVRTIANGTICAQPVSQGNMHAIGACRTPKHSGRHTALAKERKLRKRAAREAARTGIDQRGVSVRGTSGSKAKTHRAGRKSAKV